MQGLDTIVRMNDQAYAEYEAKQKQLQEQDATVECHECGTEKPISQMFAMEIYEEPWLDHPKTIYVCKDMSEELKKEYPSLRFHDSCRDLLDDHEWADFRFFTCCECGRMIYEQHPCNGWHIQYRYTEADEQICLQCYEKQILAEGVPREKFVQGKLDGMFFSGDNHEPLDAGYEVVKGFENRFVNGYDAAKLICKKAIKLIDSDHKVVVGYESMAYGGGEGYITLFAKKETEGGAK